MSLDTPEALARYAARVATFRRGVYRDYPWHVHLETATACNARCGFCPHGAMPRAGATMSDRLIEKVLCDLEAIPREVEFLLSPFKVNEPFLDPRLFDVLAEANRRLPQAALCLTTNATPLTEKLLDRLAAVERLNYLWVSMNDHRPAEYEAAMGLRYELTLRRLQMIHAAKARGLLTFPVVLGRVGDGSAADGGFARWVAATFPLFDVSISPRGDWIGQVTMPAELVPAAGCTRWFELSITATGVVAHCCMDGKAEWPIGDVTRQSVLEVYNSPGYRRLRLEAPTRLDAIPCRYCAYT